VATASIPSLDGIYTSLDHLRGRGLAATARRPFNVIRMLWDTALVLGLLLLNKPGAPGAMAFFVILSLMVLKSPLAAFKALAICSLGLMINLAVFEKSMPWTVGRLILPMLAFIRFSVDMTTINSSLFARKSYLAFVGFVITMTFCSLVSGWFYQIALLKLLNFWATISAIFAGMVVLRKKKIDCTEWIVSLILVTTIIAFASIALGFSHNFVRGKYVFSNYFVGAFSHPNCHSLYGATFVSFLACIALLTSYKNRWIAIALMAIWPVFMVWSKARTGVLAISFAFAILVLLARPLRNRLGWRLRLNLQRSTLLLMTACVLILGLAYDGFTDRALWKGVVGFLQKSSGPTELVELDTSKMLGSRIGLIEFSWQNFRENPLCGIGFGVAKTKYFAETATIFTAPVEKGFLPTAILEEGGILGTAAFVLFLVVLIWELKAEGNVPGLAVLAAFLATNLGEVGIFAVGGTGTFGWTMFAAAVILGDHCWHPQRADGQPRSTAGASMGRRATDRLPEAA
jgi:hypothetical protein